MTRESFKNTQFRLSVFCHVIFSEWVAAIHQELYVMFQPTLSTPSFKVREIPTSASPHPKIFRIFSVGVLTTDKLFLIYWYLVLIQMCDQTRWFFLLTLVRDFGVKKNFWKNLSFWISKTMDIHHVYDDVAGYVQLMYISY